MFAKIAVLGIAALASFGFVSKASASAAKERSRTDFNKCY